MIRGEAHFELKARSEKLRIYLLRLGIRSPAALAAVDAVVKLARHKSETTMCSFWDLFDYFEERVTQDVRAKGKVPRWLCDTEM